MKKLIFTFPLLMVFLAPISKAQIYDVTADFSPSTNPNGVWSYGWSSSLGGTFVPYDFHRNIPFIGPSGQQWLQSDYDPTGYQDIVFWKNELTLTTDQTPSQVNLDSIARWTAPANGSYSVVGSFAPFYSDAKYSDDLVHILHGNGQGTASVFDNVVSPLKAVPFAITVDVDAGETLDFDVGYGNRLILNAQVIYVQPRTSKGVPDAGSSVLLLGGAIASCFCFKRRFVGMFQISA